MNLWILALGIGLFIVAAFLVSAETAIGRVTRGRVEDVLRDAETPTTRRRAERLLVILNDRPRYVNVLLFLSTTFNVTAIILIGYEVVDLLTEAENWSLGIAVFLAVVAVVIVDYVLIGVAPRTLGRQHAESIALRASRITVFLATLLGPLASWLIVLGNAITPGKGFREGPFTTEAELRDFVDMAEAEDLIEDEERAMIHSVFELGETFAREVMVPRTEMVFIERTKSLRQALSLGLRSGFSRIPVIGDNADDIVGVIYLKDVVRRVFDNRDAEREETVESLMRAPYFVPDSKIADDLLRDMQAARVHMAIVIDEYGGTAGLVTIEDILEEIVGEIADEYDTAAPEVTELGDGSYRVLARMHVDDFAELVGLDIDGEEESVDTVLGLMAKRLGRVPIPGAEIDEGTWRLRAEQGAGRRNRIGTVLAMPVVVENVDE